MNKYFEFYYPMYVCMSMRFNKWTKHKFNLLKMHFPNKKKREKNETKKDLFSLFAQFHHQNQTKKWLKHKLMPNFLLAFQCGIFCCCVFGCKKLISFSPTAKRNNEKYEKNKISTAKHRMKKKKTNDDFLFFFQLNSPLHHVALKQQQKRETNLKTFQVEHAPPSTSSTYIKTVLSREQKKGISFIS